MRTDIVKVKKKIVSLDSEKSKIENEINEHFSFDFFEKLKDYERENNYFRNLPYIEKMKVIFVSEYNVRSSFYQGVYESVEEIEAERDKELKPKYENLKRLENRLAKQKKQRSLANAYLNKIRLDASTVKSRLKDLDICPYCGNEADELEADHIYPVSSGGLSIAENMVNVCKPCNRNKGHLTLRQFIKRYDLDRDYIENRLDELGKRF